MLPPNIEVYFMNQITTQSDETLAWNGMFDHASVISKAGQLSIKVSTLHSTVNLEDLLKDSLS